MTWSRKLAIAASALALIGAAGCGGSSTQSTGGSGQSTRAAAANTPTVTITSPQSGAKVGSSFPLTFTSSVPIGALDTGEDHVHVVIDGNTSDFTVVTAHKTMVTNLSPGKHTVGITLQHADHSPAGAQDQVTVTVAKGAGMKSGTQSGNKSGTMNGSNSGNTAGNGNGYSY